LSIVVVVFNVLYMATLIMRMQNYENLSYELSEINVDLPNIYKKSIGE